MGFILPVKLFTGRINTSNAICRLTVQTFMARKKSNDKYLRALKFQLQACPVSNKLRLLEIPERKQAGNFHFTPAGNFPKLFDTPWKFQGQKPRDPWNEIPHRFFLNTLAFTDVPWKFHFFFN